ncbi:MAG: 3-keto-5-aminohexanoate cleavage protein [Deltaproteobacteria bacterium]|nr:3-keto-5-aminohexanoate cleavage protein [Deltaproteobacteria bacterium]
MTKKAIITCALTGVLTNPEQHPVPVTPEQMADEAQRAVDAGASILHIHIRNQNQGMGHLPSWDANDAEKVISAIKTKVGDVIINLSTGVLGKDISGPESCLRRIKPEIAACNAGTLNYLKIRANGDWAWPPMVFDNPVEKIQRFIDIMKDTNTRPEFECFDTGHVRCVNMFEKNGMAKNPSVNLVMGVASGMPLKATWLPLLREEMSSEQPWQVTAIGREDIWPVHQKAAELGANLRTGLEDTFYLPDGSKATSNGELITALAQMAQDCGREIASVSEAREILNLAARD